MVIEKRELSQKINRLKQAVPTKTPMAALLGVLVSDGYLTANNMETAIKAKIDAIDDGPFIIPSRAFGLINNLPDGMIEIIPEQKELGFSITIKADKIKNKFQTVDPSLFPLPEERGDEDSESSIRAEKLMASIRRVSYAIPQNYAKPTMSSLCLQASGGTLNFVGLDGRVIAWDRMEFEGEFELLIPKGTVEKLLSLGLTGEVRIRHNKNGCMFATNDYVIHTRITEGKYFDYARMFSDLSMHTVIARTELLEAVTRAKMCAEEKNPVRLKMEGSELNVSIRNATMDYQENIGLQDNLPTELTIGFDPRLVIETIKAFDCENIAINLESAKAPMIIEAEDSDFKAMVLPVIIRG